LSEVIGINDRHEIPAFESHAWTTQYSKIFQRRLEMIKSKMPLAWKKQAADPEGKFVDIR